MSKTDKIIFYRRIDGDVVKVTMEGYEQELDDVLATFRDFLAGCGFMLSEDEEVEIVRRSNSVFPNPPRSLLKQLKRT
jgi:hypothetical protein